MEYKNQNQRSLKRSPRIMIHTCNQREWYVKQFLFPSLVNQGFLQDEIIIWHDYTSAGNLQSFLNSCNYIINNYNKEDAIWHIQDDILISSGFKSTIEEYDNQPIVCGFVCEDFNRGLLDKVGRTPLKNMWLSFPCIKIKNSYIYQFIQWYNQNINNNVKLQQMVKDNKHDDGIFLMFLKECHSRQRIINLYPNIVEHIDYLLGWSITNKTRGKEKRTAFYWREPELTRELAQKLERFRKNE